jgi:hypothetical protein
VSVPPTGVNIAFAAASTAVAGNYSIPVNGSAGSATSQVSLALQVDAGTPTPFGFILPQSAEVGIAQGGSASIALQLDGTSNYEVSLSVAGLPSGVTAAISPQIVTPGGSFTVQLSASGNAPATQDASWSVVGTPAANVSPVALPLLLDVTTPNGVGWSNRTGYVSTRATPYGAVYDSAHQIIYSSNRTWNRIDVISDSPYALVKSIPIRDPRGVALSLDGKTVWVATGSQVMYGVDTTSQKVTKYQLPNKGVSASSSGTSWEGGQVIPLADGTLMLIYSTNSYLADEHATIWTPGLNTLNEVAPPPGGSFAASWRIVAASADGKHVFSIGDFSDETCFSYDVASKTVSAPIQLAGYGMTAVASPDGSRLAISDAGGFNLYDGSFHLIGPLPGGGGGPSIASGEEIFGGSIFSADGGTLYEEAMPGYIPLIITVDVTSRQATALAPAMPVTPATIAEMSPPFYFPIPFAIDTNGILLGIQYHGIAFDDALAHINFAAGVPGTPTYLQHMTPYSGPLAGGTTSSGFGNAFSLTPDVYYGPTRGTATLDGGGTLSITSPPMATPGPVDVKFLFPDGLEVYDPEFFTFGTSIQDAITSGGPPQGGSIGELDAFGLPLDPSQDTVAIGNNHASVTSVPTQYAPFEGEQTSLLLSFTVPPGSPGWADVTVTTPNGTGTLSKAFFYAKSVSDYATTDKPTFVLYDSARNNVYLSAGDHIDVFSIRSSSFVAPLAPPAKGTSKQFQGLALTPDGKYLLAADFADNSLAAINPDLPSDNFVVSVVPTPSSDPCPAGPLFVAGDNHGHAFVVSGSANQPPQCFTGGSVFIVNLATKTSGYLNYGGCNGVGGYVQASKDGTVVGIGGGQYIGAFQIYDPAEDLCPTVASPAERYGVATSGDGNVFGALDVFLDRSGNVIGRMGSPIAFYSNAVFGPWYKNDPNGTVALENPLLNDSGSLYVRAYPNFVDFVDVQHGMLRLRLSLSELIQSAVGPMAIDSGAQRAFLITDKGLTIVDLGQAPLSIGSLSQTTGTVGAQIVLRGSGFEDGISAEVGGVPASVAFTDANTVTLTIPAAAEGAEDIILNNPDGTTYTLENALTVL